MLSLLCRSPRRRTAAGVLVVLLLFTFFTSSSQASFRIHGTVLNSRTGAPVSGAVVRVGDDGEVVLSGIDGRFTTVLPDTGSVRLHIRHVGFEPFSTILSSADSLMPPLQVRLREAVYSVDPVVATATRDLVTADASPFAVEAISGADLRMKGAGDVGELLSTVPGVLLQSYGALGDVQTLSLRGSTASQVLIMLDGHRLNSAQSGEIDLSSLPLESVRRIEIVRGGASAQYGADAIGGVINIITGEPSLAGPFHLGVGSTAGSFGMRGARVNASLRGSTVSTSIAYRYLRSDNAFLYAGQDGKEMVRQNADMQSHLLSGMVQTRLDATGGNLSVHGEYYRQESGDPGSIAYPLARARKLSRNLTADVDLQQPLEGHLVSVDLYLHALRFGYTDPDSYIPTSNDNRNTALGVEIGDTFVPSDRISVSYGYSYRADRYAGNGLDGDHARGTHGVYLQGDVRPFGSRQEDQVVVSVIPALRWDRFSDFGSSLSPKLGVAASAGSAVRVTLKGNLGTSFRAPTFNDLYWPFDGFTAGNPALKPERATDFDAGIVAALRAPLPAHVSLTYYANLARDLILWGPDNAGLWTPTNVGRASIHGWETGAWIGPIFGALQAGWSMTTIDAVNTTHSDPTVDGKVLPYRPAAMHKVALRYGNGGFEATIDAVALARRFTNASNTASLPPVHTIDVAFAYQWVVGPGALDLLCTFRNLENVRYQLIDGYPLPGREVRVSLGYQIGRGGGEGETGR
jgi:vitamin B12 transporter